MENSFSFYRNGKAKKKKKERNGKAESKAGTSSQTLFKKMAGSF